MAVARQGLLCYTAVARLGFKRRTTAVLKSNLIRSIELGTAVARCLKQALLTKVVWSKWLDIGLVLFLHFFFIDLDFKLVCKTKKDLVLYSAILTSYFVNDAFVAKVITCTCFIVMFLVL